jgi:glycosyltransferase involved in cell wall biosynthesis
LRSYLRDFDIVNVQFLSDWGFCSMDEGGIQADEVQNHCLAATPWGSDIVDPPGEAAATERLRQMRRELLQAAAGVSAFGHRFAGVVARFADLRPGDVSVMSLGVDTRMFWEAGHPRSSQTPMVGFMKGFREVYGAEFLVRAMPAVVQAYPGVRFQVVGDGPTRPRCRDLADSLGVMSHIDWLPRQPHGQLPGVLAQWDVSVLPSLHESFCVAAIESSAMGLPVVASDVCGHRDTVRDRATGLLVEPENPQALAEAVVMLLGDAGLRREMGRRGREFVKREYEWDVLHDRWATFFEQVRERRTVMV